eukprot:TRINITY_DN5661_c0_g5_i1.p1 TRINITY_DN5661_c0_g5~~TRINITY_DN5661_c0_g5_i1.p1  ORF type:complete len:835 (+),score=208.17 TRINITY_DN5661_c0_g5_i1:69-2573(+)
MAGAEADIIPMEVDAEAEAEVQTATPGTETGRASKVFIDCLIVIDAVYDFLDEKGRFAEIYGLDDTEDVRKVKTELDALVAESRELDIDVVIVSSHYKPKQFRTAEGVCSTAEGSKVVLPSAAGLKVIYKQGNSVLESGSKPWLLEKINQKRVAVCGVTTPACIAASVAALQGKCAGLYVARDAVAARRSTNKGVDKTFATFEKNHAEITVVPKWRDMLSAQSPAYELYYVNGSVPSFRVQMALHEHSVAHKAHRMRVMSTPKPTRTPEFLAINPRGQTPVLAKNGVNMRESLAILTYLGHTHEALIIPGDAEWASRCLALAQESEKLRLNLDCLEAFYKEVKPDQAGAILADLCALVKEFKVWDEYAKGGGFLCGTPSLNIADCAFFPILAFCVRRGMVIADLELQNLEKYWQKMVGLSSVRRSTPSGWDTWDPTERAGNNVWAKAITLAMKHTANNKDAVYVVENCVKAKPVKRPKHRPDADGKGNEATCSACGMTFASRNKLHTHLSEKGPHGSDGIEIPTVLYNPEYYDKNEHNADKPVVGVGAGDTELHFGLLPEDVAEGCYERLEEEIEWFTMYHMGGEVPRLVATQGEIEGGVEPCYRHPADEQPVMRPWTPEVDVIRKAVEKRLGVKLNHALIQLYRGGKDFISPHADKTLDITRNTPIINVSMGRTRDMLVTSKKDVAMAKKIKHRVSLVHNSVFSFGWDSNLRCLHTIKPDKRPISQMRPDERHSNGSRISLTFRNISTFKLPTGELYGQGAVHKTKGELLAAMPLPARTAEETENEVRDMIYAFGAENSSSLFDWDKKYGKGFTCMNINEINGHNEAVVSTVK